MPLDHITLRIQLDIDGDQGTKFTMTVPKSLHVEELKRVILKQKNLSKNAIVVLSCQEKILKDSTVTLDRLEFVTNNVLISCIVTKREDEQVKADDEEAQYQDDKIEPVLECEFIKRPLGFAVWANEKGENAIVTKVAGQNALTLGIQIGYCVYKINDQCVLNKKHKEVLFCLKKTICPLRIIFVDLGQEYTIAFKTKPLGFTVVQDKEDNNAKVSQINMRAAALGGVRIGSYVTAVNNKLVFGMKHREILSIINNALFPINLRFRRPPKLSPMPSGKKDRTNRKK